MLFGSDLLPRVIIPVIIGPPKKRKVFEKSLFQRFSTVMRQDLHQNIRYLLVVKVNTITNFFKNFTVYL